MAKEVRYMSKDEHSILVMQSVQISVVEKTHRSSHQPKQSNIHFAGFTATRDRGPRTV